MHYDKRIQRFEEQIVDLSAQLGTVETMGQGGGAAAPSAGGQFSGGGSGGPTMAGLRRSKRRCGRCRRR